MFRRAVTVDASVFLVNQKVASSNPFEEPKRSVQSQVNRFSGLLKKNSDTLSGINWPETLLENGFAHFIQSLARFSFQLGLIISCAASTRTGGEEA
jgi:hypothetical protein